MMILSTLLFVLAAAPSATPASAVYIEERIETGPVDGPLEDRGLRKTWIAPKRLRIESGDRVEIYDAERGLWRMVDRAGKVWTQGTRKQIAANEAVPMTAIVGLTVDEDTGDALVPTRAFERAPGKEKIGTWDAIPWRATAPDPEGGEDRVWIAEAGVKWSDLQRIAIDLFPGRGDQMKSYLRQVEALGGFPVRTERVNDETRIRYTVTKIETVKIDPSLFAPATDGYREVPTFGR